MGFVEKDMKGRWRPTARAASFVTGGIKVFRRVWPHDVPLPAICKDEELVSVEDVVGEDWMDRRNT